MDFDFVVDFTERAFNGILSEYGIIELQSVLLYQNKENQDIDNHLRWSLEDGSLFILFDKTDKILDLAELRVKIAAILYVQNKVIAKYLVDNNLLAPNSNILFSYLDLSLILDGVEDMIKTHCFDTKNMKTSRNSKSIIHKEFYHLLEDIL